MPTTPETGLRLLFPEAFYQTRLRGHEALKAEYLDRAVTQCNEVDPEWNCRVLTNRERSILPHYSSLLEALASPISDMCTQFGATQDIHFSFSGIWMNLYRKGHFQETHHHSSRHNNFSFVYFMNYDAQRDAQLCFHSDRFHSYCASGIHEILDLIGSIGNMEVFPVDAEEGDLIVFPSHLRHSVAFQGFETNRCTIAGNFLLTKASSRARRPWATWELRAGSTIAKRLDATHAEEGESDG